MLPKINSQSYEQCYPKRLKKFFQRNLNYISYSAFVSKMDNATVGSIPKEIVKLFDGKEKAEKIKLFQVALGETADAIRDKKCSEKKLEVLSNNFNKILPNDTQIKLEYIGRGGYKNVYKLGLKDRAGNKIMHDKAFLVYDMDNELFTQRFHGAYAEPNSWIYLQWNMGHKPKNTQFIKHYFSDLKNGYSLTEFIDNDIANTTKEFEHNKLLGLILIDCDNNPRINKKVYDIGGLTQYDKFFSDRLNLKYFKKIANRNSKNEREKVVIQLAEQIKNPKIPHRDKMANAITFYKSLPEWYWSRTSEKIPITMIW